MAVNTNAMKLGPYDTMFFENKKKAANFCWDNHGSNTAFKAMGVTTFLRELNGLDRYLEKNSEYLNQGYLALPADKLIDFTYSLKLKNYEDILLQLQSLQLRDALTKYELLARMQESPESFRLKYVKQSTNMDQTVFGLQFVRKDNDTYNLSHFDAVLRKAIKMPNARASEVEKKMAGIDWESVLYGHTVKAGLLPFVENIKQELADLTSSRPEGKRAAENLKFRFWSDTILESEIEDRWKLTPLYEITKRFEGDGAGIFSGGCISLSQSQAYAQPWTKYDTGGHSIINN
jgi:hypothetical protein